MAKKRTLDLTPIWKDRCINKAVKLKVNRALICPFQTHGAEAWILKAFKRKVIGPLYKVPVVTEPEPFRGHILSASWNSLIQFFFSERIIQVRNNFKRRVR